MHGDDDVCVISTRKRMSCTSSIRASQFSSRHETHVILLHVKLYIFTTESRRRADANSRLWTFVLFA